MNESLRINGHMFAETVLVTDVASLRIDSPKENRIWPCSYREEWSSHSISFGSRLASVYAVPWEGFERDTK